VADALHAYRQADALAATLAENAAARVRQAQLLLGDLLEQDIEVQREPEGEPHVAVKQGTAPDRIPSATDPEQRHGHKSKEKKFTGHKVRTVVDTESGLILDTEVLPGNAGDASDVKAQIERVVKENEVVIDAVLGDCAFGNGATRAEFAATAMTLHAKVPAEAQRGDRFPKSRFTLDLAAGRATCIGSGRSVRAVRCGRTAPRVPTDAQWRSTRRRRCCEPPVPRRRRRRGVRPCGNG
jgi:transposase